MRVFPSLLLCLLLALIANVGGELRAAENAKLRPEARGFPSIRTFSPRGYEGHNQIWTALEGKDEVM
jgi:hypothetical protein